MDAAMAPSFSRPVVTLLRRDSGFRVSEQFVICSSTNIFMLIWSLVRGQSSLWVDFSSSCQ